MGLLISMTPDRFTTTTVPLVSLFQFFVLVLEPFFFSSPLFSVKNMKHQTDKVKD